MYLIRAQNAGVTIRLQPEETLVELFEVSPHTAAVMGTVGKLICSYPGPAIAVPNSVFNDASFRAELANFLSMMDKDVLAPATTRKAGSEVDEERDTAHPRYITELLTGILRAVGRPADIERISKRIGDDVILKNAKLPWRRSSLWLVIRVAMQITLDRNDSFGRTVYKTFMLFLMNDLARQAPLHNMSNDVLQWISAKLSRRLTKLDEEAPNWLSDAVLKICTDIRALLNQRWTQVQTDEATSLTWNPSVLDFSADTRLTLLNSSGYINDALQTQCLEWPSSSFEPKKRLRGTLKDFLSSDRTFFKHVIKDEPYVTLYDLEREIVEGIDGWIARIAESEINDACEGLELLANNYSVAARTSYAGNSEDLSRMILTIIELWIALDKLVVKQIPILCDYSPEIPVSLLEKLLLRDPLFIRRLPLAVKYIRQRACNAQYGYSVFSDTVNGRSFAVRYFDQSLELQSLRNRILDAAGSERKAKRRELAQLNEDYAKLNRRARNTDHTYTTDHLGYERHDRHWCCPRCIIDAEMRRMKIAVHEWPLPVGEHQVKRVVFELDCPVSFNMWRSAIFHLLVDLCSPSKERIKPCIELEGYSGLQGYHQSHSRSRITLASDTKAFVQSHYRETSIPSDESTVCVNNGLTFYGFDTNAFIGACTISDNCDISSFCTLQLPVGPYHNLQGYLKDTTHTSNQVLCSQANCDNALSIHEFMAFGHLRSGSLLQWLNILREIRAHTLRFRHDEIHFLVAQASGQVGIVSEAMELVWHSELCHVSFRRSLLKELDMLVTAVSGNWLEAMTMATVTFLVSRMLATDIAYHDADTDAQALDLLWKVREKTFSWVLELSRKLKDACEAEKEDTCETESEDTCETESEDGCEPEGEDGCETESEDDCETESEDTCETGSEDACEAESENAYEAQKEDLRGRLRDVAAICRSTFETGSIDARQLLCSPRSLEILLSCAIIIHDNTPAKLNALSATSRLLISRDRRLAWKLEQMVRDAIMEGNDGINSAIRHVWAACPNGLQWIGFEECSWLTNNTSVSMSDQSQKISLDVLDGSLLVNGKPLGRLPLRFQQDSLFTYIFGGVSDSLIRHTYVANLQQQVLDVVPTDMVGMEYATGGFISEHCVSV